MDVRETCWATRLGGGEVEAGEEVAVGGAGVVEFEPVGGLCEFLFCCCCSLWWWWWWGWKTVALLTRYDRRRESDGFWLCTLEGL